MNFDDHDLCATLDRASEADIEAASFGIIRMDPNGIVEGYNLYEARLSGISPDRVLGKHFFSAVAPCTNNYLVAQRYEDDAPLDCIVDYVFTLKMRPTKVRLRLLTSRSAPKHYLLVTRV